MIQEKKLIYIYIYDEWGKVTFSTANTTKKTYNKNLSDAPKTNHRLNIISAYLQFQSD